MNCSIFKRMEPNEYICTLNLAGDHVPPTVPDCPTRERLTVAFLRLRNIELMRTERGEALFGKCAEDRIVWRELLELELQFVDEQFARISATAATRTV